MGLLTEEHKYELAQIDMELQPLNQRISNLNNPMGLVEREKDLIDYVEKMSRETLTKKEKKLSRDRKVFRTNKAY